MKIRKTATSITISAVLITMGRAYDTPPNIERFYKEMFPLTEKVETVAQAESNGEFYYIVWGTTRPNEEKPDDTEGCFKVDSSGNISRINGSTPSDFPYYYISERKVWRPLLQSFVEWEISNAGGVTGLESKISQKTAITEQLAKAYQENGVKIPSNINIIINEKGDFMKKEEVKEVLNKSNYQASEPKKELRQEDSSKQSQESHSMEWQ